MTFRPAHFFPQAAGVVVSVFLLPISAPAQPSTRLMLMPSSLAAADTDETTNTGSSFDNLEIVDTSLRGKLAVLRVGSGVGENNLLTVFVGLKNRTAHRLALEIETIYKDNMGQALNEGSWIVLVLKPHEQRDYRSSSISEEAVDFLVRVRRANPPVIPTHN